MIKRNSSWLFERREATPATYSLSSRPTLRISRSEATSCDVKLKNDGVQFKRVTKVHIDKAWREAGFISFKCLRGMIKHGTASTGLASDIVYFKVRPANGVWSNAIWPKELAAMVARTNNTPEVPTFLEYPLAGWHPVELLSFHVALDKF